MEEHNIPYFRSLWKDNVADLQKQCEIWEKICVNDSVPDDVHGDIRTNIGLARLLMNQKLKQFKGLIDDSEFNSGEKEITCLDLQGFWDMVYNEVEKIKNCFEKLKECKNNGWKFKEEDPEKFIKKKVPIKKEAISSRKDESSQSRALAAKQRLAEAKKKMLALREQQKTENFVEISETNTTEITKSVAVKEPNESSKEEQQRKSGRRVASAKLNSQIETMVMSEDEKSKTNLERSNFSSKQNKENCKPESNIKRNSKAEANSNEVQEKSSVKKRGKSKDYGKLQCVTRSAKKALLLNTV